MVAPGSRIDVVSASDLGAAGSTACVYVWKRTADTDAAGQAYSLAGATDLIDAEIARIVALPDYREKIAAQGLDPTSATPAQTSNTPAQREPLTSSRKMYLAPSVPTT